MNVVVHAADIADRDGARLVLVDQPAAQPRLAHLWVDAGYQGSCVEWIAATLGWTVEVVRKPPRRVWVHEDAEPPAMPTGFQVLPGAGSWSAPSPGWAATGA